MSNGKNRPSCFKSRKKSPSKSLKRHSAKYIWNKESYIYKYVKMLTSENLLESLIDQIKVTDIFDSLLFQWNSNQKCFQLKSKRMQGVYKVRLVISATYTLLVLLQIIWTWKNISIFVKLHSMFLFTGLLLFIYTHSVFCSKAELIVSYLNGMLIFEHQRKG